MKTIYLLIIAFVIFLACNKKRTHKSEFEINGTITEFDSSYVELKSLVDGDLNTIDSMFISNSKFSFKGSVDNPELCYLVFGDMNHIVKIFLENSQINFNAHIDSLENASIHGSKSQNEFKSYEEEIHPFENKMADLFQQYKAASDQNNKPLMGQIDSLRQALNKDMDIYIKNYIGTHKSSKVAPYILSKISNKLKVSELDSLLRLINKSLDESAYIQSLKEKLQILRNLEPGKKAPEFSAIDTADNNFSLSFCNGKVVLINFWASWNDPSRRENLDLLMVYKEFSIDGFEIIGISLDNDKEQWTKAIKEDNLPWKQISDLKLWKSEVVKMYGISEIPFNVLIDKKGIIIDKNLKQKDLKEKLEKLLKKRT
jgi:peroxiredoxin